MNGKVSLGMVSRSPHGGKDFFERLGCFLRRGHKWNTAIAGSPVWMNGWADAICWHCGMLKKDGVFPYNDKARELKNKYYRRVYRLRANSES